MSRRSFSRRRSAPERGRLSEDLACEAMVRAGYEIIERNYKTPRFEIDIIARERGVLVFAEVRARRAGAVVHPLETVDRSKVQRLLLGARHYMARRRLFDVPVRFDVVSVEWHGERPRVEIIRNALTW